MRSVVFSLFGKKPSPDSKPAAVATPVPAPAPAKRASGDGLQAAPVIPGRLSSGTSAAFAGDGPGRFANRLKSREAKGSVYGSSTAVGSAFGRPSRTGTSTYSYSLDRGLSTIGSEGGGDAIPFARSGLSLPGDTSELGPMTEAAFTQLPSQLDMGSTPRRRTQLSNKDIPEALDDCALSFANGQATEALRRIEEALANEDLGVWSLQAWLMRFDLYEHLGLRAPFETKAAEFSKIFERSAPVWPATGGPSAEDLSPRVLPTVNITGLLTDASAAPLSALRKTLDRYPGVQLDFSRLQGADADGARFLLVMMQSLKRAGKQVKVANEEALLKHVMPRVQPGDKSGDATSWLLYLEVLEILGAQEEFERVAREYATTFDVSPPFWQKVVRKVTSVPVTPPQDDRFYRYYIEGDVVSPADSLLADIERHAATHPVAVLDLSRTRRIDFISCSQLVNLLGRLQAEGKGIEIRSPNEMIATLLLLMSANEIARIVPRRG